MSAYLENLTALLPSLKHHMPATGVMVAELLGELTMATKLGVVDARSGLNRDAENLHAGLSAVMEARMASVGNADIEAAETALHALILDMRNRATSRIRDRTAMIRVNAEVSAHRADPDADVMDLTEGYRLMAALPVRDDEEESLLIHDLGLPEKGGKSGRVEGDVLVCNFHDDKQETDQTGPINTFYLPSGHSVNLLKGEQIRLHVHGESPEDRKLTLNDFKDKSYFCEVESLSDDVMLYGPATFEVSSHYKMSDIRKSQNVFDREKSNRSLFWKAMDSIYFDKVPLFMIAFVCPVMILGNLFDLKILTISSGVTGLLVASLDVIRSKLIKKKDKKLEIKMGISAAGKNTIQAISGWRGKTRNNFTGTVRKVINERMSHRSVFRFYPLRKIIINENEGVRQIEPLKALSAPTPDISMSTVVPIRTKV